MSAVEPQPLLKTEGLEVHFPVRAGFFGQRRSTIKAVDGVDLTLALGETLGLVGESGSGKTTTGRAIMRLERPTGGRVVFDGRPVQDVSEREFRKFRRQFQIVFQDPYSSLDPRMTVRSIIAEPMVVAGVGDRTSRVARVTELLRLVGLEYSHGDRYPHALSGGQRQRVGIARALALNPQLLILDEPVSALDVSLQAQIVNLLKDIQQELGLAYLFISHDLSVVRQMCDRVAIIYLGRIVETGPLAEIFDNPSHPYTQALLSAVPIENPKQRGMSNRIVLRGDAASPSNPPSGCHFHPRCFRAEEICSKESPALRDLDGTDHSAACHFAGPKTVLPQA
jgi:oligopeptide/dipeptide ABC transporter ATP-binding protein